MEITLKVEGGTSHGRQMLVRTNQRARFGRGELMDFAVPEDGVMSSTHFEIECFVDRCVVRDLRSRNGTWLNQQAVGGAPSEQALNTGDQLRAGETLFLISVQASQDQVAPKSNPRMPALSPRGTVEAFQDESTNSSRPPVELLRPEGDSVNFIPGAVAVFDVVAGTGTGREIRVKIGQTFSVGRSRQTDHPFLDDLAMSGRHMQVEFLAGEVAVQDLGSRNGMLVNGIPCKRAILIEGDRVVAGDSVFVLRFEYQTKAGSSPFTKTMAILAVSGKPEAEPLPLAGLSYQRFHCRSGLTLFRGFESLFDPVKILTEISKSLATSILLIPRVKKPSSKGASSADPKAAPERMPLFDWLTPDEQHRSPTLASSVSLTKSARGISERWGRNSFLCFLHQDDDASLPDSLQQFVHQQAAGPLKFLATQVDYFRPSQLTEILANGDPVEMKRFLGSSEAVFTEIHGGDRWALFANRGFENVLKSCGLNETPGWKR